MSSANLIVMGDNHPRGSNVLAMVERSVRFVKVLSRVVVFTMNRNVSDAECHRTPNVLTVSSLSMFNAVFEELCAFCGTKETNEVLYGAFYSTLAISVHHNCMFLASGLSQRGNPNIGIVGFMLPDLEKEISRGQKLHCCYCKKRGATIGCVEAKCKKSFHLPCGIKNGTLHQFFSSFKSFCRHHMPKQAPLEINEDELYCHICYTALTREELQNCLYSPCCRKNWFHKYCLQQYAFNAGMYFIKCPLCNNTTEFINEMKIHGIHIPEKDASWEQEENAFQDLLVRPECGAVVCKCAKGRNHCSER
ncbi:G2/M phase-specific E3 ubiquitin-protein ligase-like [Uloborus diversus]|uniref:G2/M phase-specific E3 ubiquitin-protein ligase-like n=1 Tax=Uloborus diversus TaxID=327109 RepID=UPI0024097B67|nr:G2/M phase-specific E3 ubiquitin-protein ligase-like [Uloborus diversus]